MLVSVVTNSRSAGIGNGLTYESVETVLPGCLVEVPLRSHIVEGIVIAVEIEQEEASFDLKKVVRVLSRDPLLTSAQIKTMQWMAQYYCVSLRQILTIFLPSLPWHSQLSKEQTVYSLIDADCVVRGKKQMLIIQYLRERGEACDEEIFADTGVNRAVLTALDKRGCLASRRERKSQLNEEIPTYQSQAPLPKLTANQTNALENILRAKKPVLLLSATNESNTSLYAHLVSQTLLSGKGVLLLSPDVYSAKRTWEDIRTMFGPRHVVLIHSQMPLSRRREAYMCIQQSKQMIVVGTRTALFSPLSNLGLIIMDREHDENYKSDQTPRYHTRLVAEILASFSQARLVLSSQTPSVDSWHHASAPSKRYELQRIDTDEPNRQRSAVHIIDLRDTQFGTAYPFSPILLQAIDERLKRGEQSVLLLNRRGAGTALLCLECRQTVRSPVSHLPMTVHTVGGIPRLIDHYSGLTQAVPARCPHCGSIRLFAVGAGTERIETLLKQFFPKARTQRLDRGTMNKPPDIAKVLDRARQGEIDILIGTQPVIRALSLPQVTLSAAVIADVGLSLPDFRAGERVFQLLSELVNLSIRYPHVRDVLIQTFHPDAPEISFAAKQQTQEYLTLELLLRTQSGYPPASQLIALIVRGEKPGYRARMLLEQAQKSGDKHLTVTAAPSMYDPKIWRVFLRGSNPRSVLLKLDLKNIVVDIDPIDIL